jgi:hypothetical protein
MSNKEKQISVKIVTATNVEKQASTKEYFPTQPIEVVFSIDDIACYLITIGNLRINHLLRLCQTSRFLNQKISNSAKLSNASYRQIEGFNVYDVPISKWSIKQKYFIRLRLLEDCIYQEKLLMSLQYSIANTLAQGNLSIKIGRL